MEGSAYPLFRRAVALNAAGSRVASVKGLTPEDRKEAARLLAAAFDLLPRSFAEDEKSPELESVWLEIARTTVVGVTDLGADNKRPSNGSTRGWRRPRPRRPSGSSYGDSSSSPTPGKPAAPATPPPSPSRAGGCSPSGSTRRARRRACWAMKPGDARSAAAMLTVEKANGRGDRGEMETWFARAMEADGDNLAACRIKMDWLEPKWHGSVGEMMEFGRACSETRNWRAGLPLLLPDAYHRTFLTLSGPEQYKFFRNPEVWNDVRSVYEEYLKHHPGDNAERSRYAALCYLCGKEDESHQQFEAVGDDLAWDAAYSEAYMKQIRKLAAIGDEQREGGRRRGAARKNAPPKLESTRGFQPLARRLGRPQGRDGRPRRRRGVPDHRRRGRRPLGPQTRLPPEGLGRATRVHTVGGKTYELPRRVTTGNTSGSRRRCGMSRSPCSSSTRRPAGPGPSRPPTASRSPGRKAVARQTVPRGRGGRAGRGVCRRGRRVEYRGLSYMDRDRLP